MSKRYRIVFECYESSPEAQQNDVFNFGFAHEDQIKLAHSCQDALLK